MKYGIIGSGSWGTAIAKILSDNGHHLYWWNRSENAIEQFKKRSHNPQYLSSARFDMNLLSLTSNLIEVIDNADVIIIAVPSAYVVDVLNKLDVDSFKDIVRRVSSSPSGILSWKLNHRERTWTKYDLIDHLNAQHVWEKDDYQLHATFFALRCCEPMIKLIEKWYNTASNYHLVDDTPSILANDESFKEHRHDQSIFSILRNLYGTDLYEGGFLLDTKTRG